MTFSGPDKEAFENIVEKGANAGNQHFLLFYNVFYPFKMKYHHSGKTFPIWTGQNFSVSQQVKSKIIESIVENDKILVTTFLHFSHCFSFLTDKNSSIFSFS